MQDFEARCRSLASYLDRSLSQLRVDNLWLGGLMQPEACVTAMRQLVAQENQWPLEKVRLTLRPISKEECIDLQSRKTTEKTRWFVVRSLTLEGAEWNNGRLEPSEEIWSSWDRVLFEWSDQEHALDEMSIPIYLNESRANLLCVVDVKYMTAIPKELWNEKAVAFIAWK